MVTPRRGTQGELEVLDGVTVYGFTPNKDGPHIFGSVLSRLASLECYKQVDADIYHSQAVSYNTLTAQVCMPHKLHMITFQDPYDLNEWNRISKVDSRYRLTPRFKVRLAVENRLLSHACSRANALYSQAHFLKLKSRQLFSLPRDPAFLPNPVKVPTRRMKKADKPTLCFLARWDPKKRVELFLGLASSYPDVHFIAMGHAHDPVTDRRLRIEYRGQSNLELTGFVTEEDKSRILEKSWALVNTSIREALPISFLEALAHETPIVSGENPDNLTVKYGYHVRHDDFKSAVKSLLSDPSRTEKGAEGRRYVKRVHELDHVVDLHLNVYQGLIDGESDPR